MVFFLLFYQLNTHFSDLTELLFTYDSAVCKAKLFFLNVKVINFIYKTRVSWGAEGHFKIVLSSLQLFTSPGCVCLCSIPVPPFVCYVSSFCPENNRKDETSALQLFAQTFTLEHARASTLSDVRRWGTRIVERARWRQQGLVLERRGEGGEQVQIQYPGDGAELECWITVFERGLQSFSGAELLKRAENLANGERLAEIWAEGGQGAEFTRQFWTLRRIRMQTRGNS